MTKEEAPESNNESDWLVQTLRLTAFPTQVNQITEPKWWTDLFPEPPDKSLSKPKINTFQQEGSFENGRMVLNIQPFRIDWILTVPEKDPDFEKIPSIGPLATTLNAFLTVMFRWLGLSPPLKRIAFGAILSQPASSIYSGYEKLARYLPSVRLDIGGSSDFSYQINRPRRSNILDSIKINRLSKWSVVTIKLDEIAVEPGQIQSVIVNEIYSCRLELDINTPAEFEGELPKDRRIKLFQELVDSGAEIASRGDLP
jgi:hypothetical protein